MTPKRIKHKPKNPPTQETIDLHAKARSGDIETINYLVIKNRALVVATLKRWLGPEVLGHRDFEDYKQEAFLALRDAARWHNPERGAFSTFVNFRIVNFVSRWRCKFRTTIGCYTRYYCRYLQILKDHELDPPKTGQFKKYLIADFYTKAAVGSNWVSLKPNMIVEDHEHDQRLRDFNIDLQKTLVTQAARKAVSNVMEPDDDTPCTWRKIRTALTKVSGQISQEVRDYAAG